MDKKCLHITGNQAIRLLRAARAKKLVTARTTELTHVQPANLSPGLLGESGLSSLFQLLNVSERNPLEMLVPNASSRTWERGVKSSVLPHALPAGSFMEITAGTDGEKALYLPSSIRVLVDAPPLALIHTAQTLQKLVRLGRMCRLEATLRLIALACEFCGSYARDPLHPLSHKPYYDKPNKCERFVNPGGLQAYMRDSPSINGVAYARKAALYAIDESGSPMETYANLAWTLPPRLAGLSMPRPLANKQLVVEDSRKRALLKHDSLRPDFQWPEFGTLAEYLGDEDHSSKEDRVEDKDRQQDYTVAGYQAFFLMFDDVKSVATLNRTAMMLARALAKGGKEREQYRVSGLLKKEEFAERQLILVKTLLPPVLRYSQG